MRRSALMFGCLVMSFLACVSYAQGERGYMGMELDPSPLPDLLTKHLGLEPGQGVRVRNVTVGSPAERAGLERDDLVIVLQGKKVTGFEQIVETVRAAKIGDEVSLEIVHLGQNKSVQLKLEAAQEDAKLKYPPEPEAMTTWRPGKIFRFGPDGRKWAEIPFDQVPKFDVDVDRFFKQSYTFHHTADDGDYTITIQGDPKDENSDVIVQAGTEEHRSTVGKLDAIPEKYRGPARDAIESARKNVHMDVKIDKRFALPDADWPEMYRKLLDVTPDLDMQNLAVRKDRVLRDLQEQMERMQQRMQSLEEHNREVLNRLLEKRNEEKQQEQDTKKSTPAEPTGQRAI
ncbi:MAG TPA: PDZ domain-containing protein [Sedimentisphaerales bacterium]|jgi:hypothetical protein|nr:PDZ domain-containing protein [Sedimentisphaerales bacterium]HNU30640.1 PDZ domain-containing protein [Sedimentisphaerales bacterium]